MVRLSTIDTITQKRVRQSVHEYLDGTNNLGWVLGAIRHRELYAFRLLFTDFRNYAETSKCRELKRALEEVIFAK